MSLDVYNECIFYGDRLFIPMSLRQTFLDLIHTLVEKLDWPNQVKKNWPNQVTGLGQSSNWIGPIK